MEQARVYAAHGARSISVLTEQDHFGGSLDDLMRIKEALPDVAVLRKDFLLDVEDVEVSWRAGADAVLLIASLLDRRNARRHARAGTRPGHGGAGGGARRSRTSKSAVPCAPAHRHQLPGPCHVHASTCCTRSRSCPASTGRRALSSSPGIRARGGRPPCAFGRVRRGAGGRDGHARRRRGRSPSLRRALRQRTSADDSGPGSGARAPPGRPLVKICGITRAADAEAARALGADALGFVFAPSKRRAQPSLLRELEVWTS